MNAGIWAGLLHGMVGIPGPPMMYTFQYLRIPKNIVRANLAISPLFNPGIFIYIIFGLFYPQYWPVYVVCPITGLAGVVLGSYFSKFVSIAIYYHILMMFMAGSATVLLLRGLGVVETL
eukprot:TRINITY_DN4608_c0_g1_i5.p6 TRINITY_DN4608_c0_g1~~TRINITY_DN4608_c0_g1_i5.p6  ORF type:complete len:119 (-),score=7.11 TRINITY_DN4608_c0_g1_i5:395-751(-)